jgi:MFS family permease
MRRGPLAGSYPPAVALVICALVPFLMLTAAVLPLLPLLSKSLGLSKSALGITVGLSGAGYAFGTVLAVQFAVHLPRRRMLLGYVTAFVVAAVLAAWAPSGVALGGGRLQRPDLERWNEGELAWDSPQLFARLREERPQPRARGAGSVRRQSHDPAEGT